MPMWCLELVWTCREKNAYVVPGAGVDMSREKCLCGAWSWCGHVERKMPMRCPELLWTCREKNAYEVLGAGVDMTCPHQLWAPHRL